MADKCHNTIQIIAHCISGIINAQKQHQRVISVITSLLGVLELAPAHLFSFEIFVQEEKGRLIGLGSTHDGKHALASLVVGSLGNGDAGTRRLADLANLAASAANNASHHVCGDANVLSLDLLSILIVSRRTARGSIGIGAATKGAATAVAEVGAVSSTHDARAAAVVASVTSTSVSNAATTTTTTTTTHASGTRLGANNGVIEDSASATLPVIDQALADFPNGALDALGGALNFDDTLGRLGQHFLLCNHTHAGDVLDVLDLETLSADNSSHLVVRDEELDGCREVSEMN